MARKNYISLEDFIRAFREMSGSENDELAYALYESFIIKRRASSKIQCANHECKKEVSYGDAKGWIRIHGVQRLNDKKQWKELHSEELYFCCIEHYIDELKFSTSLPY